MNATPQQWLQQALNLARKNKGLTEPNPAVGAVVVAQDTVIGSGSHLGAGSPHAEVLALATCPAQVLEHATLYVTLEPCCHYGRTPPCTDLIIDSGIKQVYFAHFDPNPQVAGQGQTRLQQAGVECIYYPIAAITRFYRYSDYWQQQQRPWLTAKLAMTHNGMIAGMNRERVHITGEEANRLTHQQRLQHSAILTTVNTIIADDPQLNVRLHNEVVAKTVWILDKDLKFPLTAMVMQTAKNVVLLHAVKDKKRIKEYENLGIRCLDVGCQGAHLDLAQVLAQAGAHGLHSLWLECGGRALHSFLIQRLAQELWLYVADHTLSQGLGLSSKSCISTAYAYFEPIIRLGNDTLLRLCLKPG